MSASLLRAFGASQKESLVALRAKSFRAAGFIG
jgi:hypothetical protein